MVIHDHEPCCHDVAAAAAAAALAGDFTVEFEGWKGTIKQLLRLTRITCLLRSDVYSYIPTILPTYTRI